MKQIKLCLNVCGTFFMMLMALACNKSEVIPGTSSLSFFNAIVGSERVMVNFDASGPRPSFNRLVPGFNYGSFNANTNILNSYSGERQIAIYNFPDTLTPVISQHFSLPVGSANSLYLTGTVQEPEVLFFKEEIPFYGERDSVAGIRFINLSPGSNPISVNLVGETPGSQVSSLPYKEATSFIRYTANSSVPTKVFEIRDEVTGNLIFTYRANNFGVPSPYLANTWMFKNNTLALIGIPGGTVFSNQQRIVVIRHF